MLALDLGSRRIGVAVCDVDRLVATPYRTIGRRGDHKVEHAEIAEIVADENITTVVVGLPLSLDGSSGPAVRIVEAEIRGLRRRLEVPVVAHDERLTTVTAADQLDQQGVRGSRRKEIIDQVAAAVILQSWIDGPGRS